MTNKEDYQNNFGAIPREAIAAASTNVGDILALAIEYAPPHAAVVVYDSRCDLALALTAAYRHCLPAASFIDFEGFVTVRADDFVHILLLYLA